MIVNIPLCRRLGRAMAFVGALGVAGCSTGSAPVNDVQAGALCDRGKRDKTILVAHVDQRGEAYVGEAPRGEYDGVVKTVPTALAAPKTPVFSRRERKDCYDKAKGVWYPCVLETRIDFSKIKGLARAPKMERARDVAVQLCESGVRNHSPKADGLVRFDSANFNCTVVETNLCPVYKATDAQKQEKKRLREERKRENPDRTDPNCRNMQHCLPKS